MTISTGILFVATSSNATSGGGRTRIVDLAREVKKHRFTPYILCFVYATQMLSGLRYLARARARLAADAGCPVYYAPLFPFGSTSLVSWLNNHLSGLILFLAMWFLRVSTVYGHGVKAGHLAIHARKISPRIKVISDIQGEVVYEYLYERGVKQPDSISRRLEQDEAEVLANSDWLIFVSNAMRSYYETNLRSLIENFTIIPCATSIEFCPDFAHRETLRREYSLDKKFVLCYAGSAETYQLPVVMCHLFKNIQQHFPNAFFLIFSHEVTVFEQYLHAENIQSSCYKIMSVPHDQIFEYLQMGDVGLLLRDDSPVNRVASPTKFAEYCLSGLPILTTPYVGDFSTYVQQFSLGYLMDASNYQVNASLLAFLQDVNENRSKYANHCNNFAIKHLTWDAHGKALSDLLTSLNYQ